MIKNDKAVYTYETKTKRLLPFVEDKLMRQCIGLASKRRDAEKNNLQKDENGKIVTRGNPTEASLRGSNCTPATWIVAINLDLGPRF